MFSFVFANLLPECLALNMYASLSLSTSLHLADALSETIWTNGEMLMTHYERG